MAPQAKSFTVENKVELLEHLIEQHEEWDDDSPDIRIFWSTAQRDFDGTKGTTWEGKQLEDKMEREEEVWLAEREDPFAKRRRGHEVDSTYDKLMTKWCKIWEGLLKKHWQHMVDTGEEKFHLVPDWVKKFVKEPKEPPPPPAPLAQHPMPTPTHYEYDGPKLQRVVESAMDRAREVGKFDLAQAVEQVYKDALLDHKLRVLLEAILTQKADKQQNSEFQGYVRIAKSKIRQAKKDAEDQTLLASSPAVSSTPAGPSGKATASSSASAAPVSAETPKQAAIVETPAPAAKAPTPAAKAPTSAVKAPPPAVKTPAAKAIAPATKAPAAKTPAPTYVMGTSGPAAASVPSKEKGRAEKSLAGKSLAAHPDPDVNEILGDLQFEPTVQALLTLPGSPIDARRLGVLKSVLTSDLETRTDILALQSKLEKALTADEPQASGESSRATRENSSVGPSTRPVRANAGKRRRTSPGPAIAVVEETRKRRRTSTGPTTAGAEAEETGKRRRTPTMDEAEETDLLVAQRAAKRRKGEIDEADENDGGNWHPTKKIRERSKKQKKKENRPGSRQSSRLSSGSGDRESSVASDLSSEHDMEATKSAYVEEIVRKRTAEEAEKAIVAEYGAVSPSIVGEVGDAGGDDLTVIGSPTMGAAQLDDGDVRDGGLDVYRPSPPPEPPGNDALGILTGAVSDAVARDPGVKRLEAKLDALIEKVTGQGSSSAQGAAAQSMSDLAAANAKTLKDIATMVSSSNLEQQNPQLSQLMIKLTHNAAEAAILAAETAKRSGEMARDVSMILRHIAPKQQGGENVGEHPVTPLSSNEA